MGVCTTEARRLDHMNQLHIRLETTGDVEEVRDVVTQAFAVVEHSDGSEPGIVDALREAGALTVSLVAEQGGEVIGNVAASPVDIGDGATGWYGIGPVAVRPDQQARGIGSRLMEQVLDTLREAGATGAVLLGEPAFYTRFGFRQVAGLSYPGAPAEYFLALPFTDTPLPTGEVSYHRAFTQ